MTQAPSLSIVAPCHNEEEGLREFCRRFLTLKGYRDGLHGLRLALLLAFYYGFYPYWLLARNN